MTARILAILALLAALAELDRSMAREVQGWRRPWLDGAMQGVTRVGSPVTVLGGLLLVAVTAPPAGVLVARVSLAALAATNLAVEGLKWGVARPRPDGTRSRSNSSFPSSHAANAYCLAAVLAWRWPRARALWWGTAALVACSRVYLNRHYPSDVLAGALLGAVLGSLAAARRDALVRLWPLGGRGAPPAW